MAMVRGEDGEYYDDGQDDGGGGGGGGGSTNGGNTNSTPFPLDQNKLKKRQIALRAAYWKYLYRLPTQDEFNGAALVNQGPAGNRFTDDASFDRVVARVATSDAADRAKYENGGKSNARPVPSGYDFATSTDYDPRATGPGGGGDEDGGGNNTQFFDADGKWIGGTNYQAYFESLFPGGTITAEQLKAKLPELQKAGISLHTNTGGDVIKLPDGSLIDVIRDVGGANVRVWNSVSSGGGGNQSATTGTGATPAETPAQRAARLATFGLGPEGLQNQRPGEMPPAPTLGDMMGQQGPIANPGTYTPGEAYNAPDYMAPAPFVAPTAAEMGQDPGYQFRLSEGQRALERSGAARGVTNTGGNMKGLLDYGQQAASQEYGNVYNRNLNTYNTNAQNAFQQYSTNALKNTSYNQDTEARRSGAFGTNSNLYQNQQTNAYNQRQKAYDDAMAAYQTRINNQRQYERDRMSDIQYAAGA
jgi:hypothetical protein